MAAAHTDTRLGAIYRRIARKRGKQKAIVGVSHVICEIAWILICDPGVRFEELGPDYYTPGSRERQTGDKLRELKRFNPGHESPTRPGGRPRPSRWHSHLTRTAQRNSPITCNTARYHVTYRNPRRWCSRLLTAGTGPRMRWRLSSPPPETAACGYP